MLDYAAGAREYRVRVTVRESGVFTTRKSDDLILIHAALSLQALIEVIPLVLRFAPHRAGLAQTGSNSAMPRLGRPFCTSTIESGESAKKGHKRSVQTIWIEVEKSVVMISSTRTFLSSFLLLFIFRQPSLRIPLWSFSPFTLLQLLIFPQF